jgi:LmbE family N-acetylglucosaminyl deacetylase
MSIYALVICPHPDDAEFGAAGTIARWIRDNKSVVYIICTDGDKGSNDRTITSEDLAVVRREEQQAAAATLGVREVVFLGYPDQGLEDTPEFRKKLVKQIRRHQPEVVLAPDPYRRYIWHRDHRICGQVVLDAVFPYARDHLAYPDLLTEGYEPHKVRELLFWGSDDVNYRSDITETFDIKLSALRCHASQIGQYESPEWLEWFKQRYRSMAEGRPFEYAEAFHQVVVPF